ncbi:hypothetical protein ACLK1S_22625 [Escherichia coli]
MVGARLYSSLFANHRKIERSHGNGAGHLLTIIVALFSLVR